MGEQSRENPLWDDTLETEKRLDYLLGELTLEEKTRLCTTSTPAIERLGIPEYSTGGEAAHGIEARHDQSFNRGEPVATTCFPQPFGLSMTWDTGLMKEIGKVVGTEARIHAKLELEKGGKTAGLCRWAPTVDMERDPRWGRTEEGYGEDPYLTGKMASAYILGMRGDHPDYIRCGATLKHFYANNAETDRVSVSSSVGIRDKYEYYLEPFRRCIEEGNAEAVMTSYNEINGVPAICDEDVQKFLKDTCRLPGHVVCDGGDMAQTVQFHHYFDTHAETVAAALKAGVDSFTDDASVVVPAIREALNKGWITEAELDRAIRNSFRTRIRLGLFDRGGQNPYEEPEKQRMAGKKHGLTAARAAEECVALLKNRRHYLPMEKKAGERIAVLGPLANEWYKDWYCGVPPYRVTVFEGIRNKYPDGEISCFDALDRVMIRIGEQYLACDPGDGELRLTDKEQGDCFLMTDWGDGGITFREVKSGRFLTAVDEIERIRLGKTEAFGWFIKEAFHCKERRKTENGFECLMDSWCGQPLFLRDGKLCAGMRPEDMPVTGGQQDSLSGIARTARKAEPVGIAVEIVKDGIGEAVSIAKGADRVILCLGANPVINAKEEIDRKHLRLPGKQEELLSEISAANPDTVLVIVSNYPYILPEAADAVPAILFTASGGQELGNGVAGVIAGEVNPAARMNMTWPGDGQALPDIGLYDLAEGGRTYRYYNGKIQYPFGYGLSYSEFVYEELTYEEPECGEPECRKLVFRVKVRNVSGRDGEEVIQLYFRKEDSAVVRPRRQLAGFCRVRIPAGEAVQVRLEVPIRELLYYDVIEDRLLLEDGAYLFMAGPDSETFPLCGRIVLSGEKRGYRKVALQCPADHYDEQRGTYLYRGYEKENSVFARKEAPQGGNLVYHNCRYEGEKASAYEILLHRITKDVRTGQRQYAVTHEERIPLTDAGVIEAIGKNREFTLRITVRGAEGIRDFRIVPAQG